ncbi:hypothetical protein HmCmsJML031_04244 [Escherichia coli]|nr:hypothetical protein HmCmsJML031_04244 [Escherichia coli]
MTPSTTDVLKMAAAQPPVFDAERDTVRGRLGRVKGVYVHTAQVCLGLDRGNQVTQG